MIDFEIHRSRRVCCATERELQPGEAFYSVLVASGGEVVRNDYCIDAWTEPPTDCIGWWRTEVPSPSSRKMHWAPRDVMLHYFEQLEDDEAKADTRYVLALLMVRKRILRLEHADEGDEEQDVLMVSCPKNDHEYRVQIVLPDRARAEEIEEELGKLLQSSGA